MSSRTMAGFLWAEGPRYNLVTIHMFLLQLRYQSEEKTQGPLW